MRISVEEFADLCRKIYAKHDFDEEEAKACVEEIVDAQCRGHVSHGGMPPQRIPLPMLELKIV